MIGERFFFQQYTNHTNCTPTSHQQRQDEEERRDHQVSRGRKKKKKKRKKFHTSAGVFARGAVCWVVAASAADAESRAVAENADAAKVVAVACDALPAAEASSADRLVL